jgi:hypothetical protein
MELAGVAHAHARGAGAQPGAHAGPGARLRRPPHANRGGNGGGGTVACGGTVATTLAVAAYVVSRGSTSKKVANPGPRPQVSSTATTDPGSMPRNFTGGSLVNSMGSLPPA